MKNVKDHFKLINKPFLLLLLLLVSYKGYSQDYEFEAPPPMAESDDYLPKIYNYGLNFSGVTTGSGLGLNFNPSFYYRFKRNVIAMGPNIQRDHFNFSGIQSFFQHDFAANFKQWVVYYHLNFLYHLKANLGPTGNEQYMNIYGSSPTFKYNTFEHYTGFGVRKLVAENLNLDTSIGVGAYYTLNGTEQKIKPPFRSDNDFSLMLKIGLTYNFNNK